MDEEGSVGVCLDVRGYSMLRNVPMALVKMDGTWPGGGEGEGAALHGSRPS